MITAGINRITGWVETLLGFVLIASVLLNCVNIGGRYFFNVSIISADELQIFAMVFITYLGLFIVSWHGAHLRMDILVQYMPQWLRKGLKVLERLTICAISTLVIVMSWQFVTRMYSLGMISENAEVPMWIMHTFVTVGVTLMLLITLAQIALSLKGLPDVQASDGTQEA
jgi:TRAP-type C4-dicarboxylate transport system permease small subunit